MINMLSLKPFLVFALLLTLAGCRPAASAPLPLPLTGARASKLGAAALLTETGPAEDKTTLIPVLAATGKPHPKYTPVDLGSNSVFGFSRNREQLAFVASGTAACPKTCFHLLDLRAWQESFPPVELDSLPAGWTAEIVFDNTGQRAAFAINDQEKPKSVVFVVDIRQRKVSAEASLDHLVYHLAFTPGGELAVYGPSPAAGPELSMAAWLLDPDTLTARWQRDLSDVHYGSREPGNPVDPTQGRYLEPGVVFSPDGGRLYIVAADEPKLVTVDFAHRSVSSATIEPPRGLLDRLMEKLASVVYAKTLNGTTKTAVISPDGGRLYVVGQTTTGVKQDNGDYRMDRTPLGLQVIDTGSGTELARLDTRASDLALAPDGRTLFLVSWPQNDSPDAQPTTELVGLPALKVTQMLAGDVRPTRLLNGETAWLSTQYHATSYDLAVYPPGRTAPSAPWTVKEPGFAQWVWVP